MTTDQQDAADQLVQLARQATPQNRPRRRGVADAVDRLVAAADAELERERALALVRGARVLAVVCADIELAAADRARAAGAKMRQLADAAGISPRAAFKRYPAPRPAELLRTWVCCPACPPTHPGVPAMLLPVDPVAADPAAARERAQAWVEEHALKNGHRSSGIMILPEGAMPTVRDFQCAHPFFSLHVQSNIHNQSPEFQKDWK